jgi:glycosyltransferase involved in cell wall biosynthesis
MNILYVVDMLKVLGGCELYTMTLATEMSRTNKVYILTNHFNYDFGKLLPGIEVLIGFKEENYKKLENKNIDAIHSSPFTAIQVGDELSKRYNAKHFITMRSNNTTGLTQEIVDGCSKIIFINEIAQKACSTLNINDKGIIIPNPIDINKFKPKIIKLKKIKSLLNKDYKTIIVSSRMDNGKEIPMFQLMNILPKLVDKIGGLNVIFLGEGSKLFDLMNKVNLNNLDLNIQFPGEVEDIYNYLNVADLVLACNRSAIEALLCEKIVFYMGKSYWKQLISNDNYYKLLFTDQGYEDYSDEDLIDHLTKILTQVDTLKESTNLLSDKMKELCDSKIIKEKIKELYIENM